jgi:hypothetical protein
MTPRPRAALVMESHDASHRSDDDEVVVVVEVDLPVAAVASLTTNSSSSSLCSSTSFEGDYEVHVTKESTIRRRRRRGRAEVVAATTSSTPTESATHVVDEAARERHDYFNLKELRKVRNTISEGPALFPGVPHHTPHGGAKFCNRYW